MSSNRTDLVKMGRYIAQLRKEKRYTQRKLGDLIDISDKTISKWENGVVAPDITVLKELANALEVTVDEILCGERTENIEKINSATIEGIKIYTKQAKKNVLKVVCVFVFVFIVFMASFIYFDNYHRWNVTNLNLENNGFVISGNLISNNKRNIFMFDNFQYFSDGIGTKSEPQVINLMVGLYYGDTQLVVEEHTYNDSMILHECFKDFHLSYDGENIFVDSENKALIRIEYTDITGEFYSIDLEII